MSADEKTPIGVESVPASSHSNSSDVDATLSSRAGRDAELKKVDSKVPTPPAPRADNIDELYAHLPPHQAEILKRQVYTPEIKAGVKAIYRYSSNRLGHHLRFLHLCHRFWSRHSSDDRHLR